MTSTNRPRAVALTTCPECGEAAEIVRRAVFESTDGPIEHSVVQCVATHHFLLPTAGLVQRTPTTPAAVSIAHPRR